MSFLSSLGNKIRNGFDEVGSIATGQPAHSINTPVPTNVIHSIQNAKYGVLANPQNQAAYLNTFRPQQSTQSVIGGQFLHDSTGVGQSTSNEPKFLQTAVHIAAAPFSLPINAAASTVDYGKALTDKITGNNTAASKAFKSANAYQNANYDTVRQFTTRPAVQLITSLQPHQATFHPGNKVERALVGGAPIQNIQAGVVSNFKQHPDLPTPLRYGLAGSYGAGQLTQDLPVAGGAIKGLKTASKTAGPILKAVDTNAFTPRASINDQQVLHDYSDYLSGANPAKGKEANDLIASARQVGEKHNIDLTNGSPGARIERANSVLDQIGSQNRAVAQGGYIGPGETPEMQPPMLYRSENPERYGIGQAELGSGLYLGNKETAGRLANGNFVTDGLHEYKLSPSAKILDSSSDEFRKIDSAASTHPSLKGLDGRQWQQAKANIITKLVKEKGYDGVKRGTNQMVVMSDKAIASTSPNAPMYKDTQLAIDLGTAQPSPQISQPHTGPQIDPLQEGPQSVPSPRTSGSPSSSNSTPQSAEDIGHALGLTDEQMAESRASDNARGGQVVKNREAAQDTRAPIDKSIGAMQHEKLPQPTAEENTAKNPFRVDIPEVQAGDYEKARSNAQLATSPVQYSAGQVTKSIHRLSSSDKKIFWKAVEDPSLIKSEGLREAVSRWNDLSNRVHATSQALGGNTRYLVNYARHNWDLSNPEDAARFQELVNQRAGASIDPYDFGGLNRQPRVFKSINEGEAAGFKLKNPGDPAKDVLEYANGAAGALKRQALAKGMTEADMNEPLKNRSFDLRNGNTLPLSEKGMHEMRTYNTPEKPGTIHGIYRGANKKLKQTLLSASEFHPINISVLKAAPAEALSGHPVLAVKGIYGTFRAQLGRGYSDRLQQSALKDGTVDAAARIGTPIKYGSDYNNEGKLSLGKSGLGEKTIFEKAMPAMHIRMVQGAIKDLERKRIPLDSPEARQLGDVINKTMGFINTEIKNDNPHLQRALSDLALAPQFTRAKWSVLKDALTKGGLGGKYARRAVVGNTATVTAISIGLGYLLGQNSDSKKDTLIKNIVHPSVATPFKDSKGNTEEIGLPSTYLSEALGLGANVTRSKDGTIGISAKPQNIPGNLANYGRARLSILPSTGLKVATNTDFANKPLYDAAAPLRTKAMQAGTTTAQGLLPIGAQGILQANAIKSHLPQASQEIVNANKPAANSAIKGLASAFGGTLRTDKTTGKGLQTLQYYDALDQATKGMDPNDKAAFASIHQQTKDAVTGKYIIKPTVFDSAAKAELYLQHPNVLMADTKLNQKLSSEGQNIDPFFKLPSAQQKAYLAYQTINKNNTQQLTAWNDANPWSKQFQQERSVFYNSLPPGDPNRPKSPIQPPNQTRDVQAAFTQYDSLADPTQKAAYFGAHPELSDYMDQEAAYTNKLLQAQGLTPLKPYPKADPDTENYTSTYMNGSKAQRAALRTGNPTAYAQMQAYLQNVDEYEVAKNGALDQLQGQTPNQQLLKGMNSLSQYDMVTNPDGSLALKYGDVNPGATTYGSVAATPQAGAKSSSYGSSGSGSSFAKREARYRRKLSTPKTYAKFIKAKKPRKFAFSTSKKSKGAKFTVAPKTAATVKLSS